MVITDRSGRLRHVGTCPADPFLIREFLQPLVLSYLETDLRRVVRSCPLASVAVNGDRYSVGVLGSGWSTSGAGPLPQARTSDLTARCHLAVHSEDDYAGICCSRTRRSSSVAEALVVVAPTHPTITMGCLAAASARLRR